MPSQCCRISCKLSEAPGRKTVRYWLTIDRPTSLRATLPKGTGMAEATEAEILDALGEAEAPAPETADPTTGPAEASPAERGKKPPAKVAARPVPRRIGKSAADSDAPADAKAAAVTWWTTRLRAPSRPQPPRVPTRWRPPWSPASWRSTARR